MSHSWHQCLSTIIFETETSWIFSGTPAALDRQAEPHTHRGQKRKPMIWSSHGYHCKRYCSQTRTHNGDDDGVAQHGGHTPNNGLIETCSFGRFTVYFFDIEHPCYDQLAPVKTRYPLSSITWLYRGSSLQLINDKCFLKLTTDQVLVFDWIAGSCLVNLLKTGQDCSEAG